MIVLYFTASGNSLHVAKSFGGETFSIPQMIKEGRYDFKDDKIGVVFPLYEWSVPPYVEEFLKKASFDCEYLFGIFTYGIYSGACATHLTNIAKESGYTFDYINRVKMVDNYITGFKMESQIKDEYKKDIDGQLKDIVKDINSSKKYQINDATFRKIGTNFMVNKEHKSPHDKFTIEDSCTKCGVCTKVCPVSNIRPDENAKVKVYDNCMSCFACTHNCPSNAIRFKGERSKERFRNSNVTLQEIVKSND